MYLARTITVTLLLLLMVVTVRLRQEDFGQRST